jgi:hypothetical protein
VCWPGLAWALLCCLGLLLQGKQLVSSQLMSNSAVLGVPNQPKKCRMSLMVLQYDLPPAGAQADGAAAGCRSHAVSTDPGACLGAEVPGA